MSIITKKNPPLTAFCDRFVLFLFILIYIFNINISIPLYENNHNICGFLIFGIKHNKNQKHLISSPYFAVNLFLFSSTSLFLLSLSPPATSWTFRMCYQVAKYHLCGHRASVNVMYCDQAKYSGSVCRKPPLKPIPSQPLDSFCPKCSATQHQRFQSLPLR